MPTYQQSALCHRDASLSFPSSEPASADYSSFAGVFTSPADGMREESGICMATYACWWDICQDPGVALSISSPAVSSPCESRALNYIFCPMPGLHCSVSFPSLLKPQRRAEQNNNQNHWTCREKKSVCVCVCVSVCLSVCVWKWVCRFLCMCRLCGLLVVLRSCVLIASLSIEGASSPVHVQMTVCVLVCVCACVRVHVCWCKSAKCKLSVCAYCVSSPAHVHHW